MLHDLNMFKPHQAMIELTRKCNLRCMYCAVSQHNWKHEDLDTSKIDINLLAKQLRNLGISKILLHGHGETTIVDGWEDYAYELINLGFRLTICTNMAKNFTDREIDILSKFSSITVSIDTLDKKLFNILRKGGDINKIMSNIDKVRSKNNKIIWVWSTVVVKETISGLHDLIREGLLQDVKIFSLCNFTRLNGVNLTHLSDLSPEEAYEALSEIEKLQIFVKSCGKILDPKAGLLETLREKCQKLTYRQQQKDIVQNSETTRLNYV